MSQDKIVAQEKIRQSSMISPDDTRKQIMDFIDYYNEKTSS